MKQETTINYLALANQVAAALPGSWKVAFQSPEYVGQIISCGPLVRSDGLELYFRGGSYGQKGKLDISHVRPRSPNRAYVDLYEGNSRVASPEIGVSETKTGEQIAADIVRRLLPEAERVNALALAQIERENDAASRKLALLESVSRAAGLDSAPKMHNSEEPRYSFYVTDRPGKGDREVLASVEVRGSDSVHFTIDTEGKQAEALIRFLRSPAYLTP